MAILKLKPNLSDGDKAKLEFRFQQIAECIGYDRLRLPIIGKNSLLELNESELSPEQMIQFFGQHLSYDASGISVEIAPKPPETCGGGG